MRRVAQKETLTLAREPEVLLKTIKPTNIPGWKPILHCAVAAGTRRYRQDACECIARHSGEHCSIGFRPGLAEWPWRRLNRTDFAELIAASRPQRRLLP